MRPIKQNQFFALNTILDTFLKPGAREANPILTEDYLAEVLENHIGVNEKIADDYAFYAWRESNNGRSYTRA